MSPTDISHGYGPSGGKLKLKSTRAQHMPDALSNGQNPSDENERAICLSSAKYLVPSFLPSSSVSVSKRDLYMLPSNTSQILELSCSQVLLSWYMGLSFADRWLYIYLLEPWNNLDVQKLEWCAVLVESVCTTLGALLIFSIQACTGHNNRKGCLNNCQLETVHL